MSTRQTYEGYVRRTIGPAIGSMELRKVRGPILDTFYMKLRRCGDLTCNGRPFIEHSTFPPLVIQAGSYPLPWMQVARTIRAAIASGQLRQGQELPSDQELGQRYGISPVTIRHAMKELDRAGLIRIHHGRQSVVDRLAAGRDGEVAEGKVEGFHNRHRHHSALGWLAPIEFENNAHDRAPAPQLLVQATG